MPRSVDIKKKAEELKRILQRYNGVPSSAENRAAYATIKYYTTNYGDQPEIRALIEEFDILFAKYSDYQSGFEEIKTILSDLGQMPSSSHDNTRYQLVKNYLRRFKDIPEVERLRYIYAFDCFPLPDTKFERPAIPDLSRLAKEGVITDWYTESGEWFKWREEAAFEYIAYVFKRYGILPAENTRPMMVLKNKVNRFFRYNVDLYQHESEQLYGFLKTMVDLGCKEDIIYKTFFCYQFCEDSVQQKIRKILIRDGACSVGYIARISIDGVHLPEEFVFYYYYVQNIDRFNYGIKVPLGKLYSRRDDYSHEPIFVHYRDAFRCPLEAIKENALKYFRDWEAAPPETIEEWRAYGQWFFFVHEKEWSSKTNKFEIVATDWSQTVIDRSLCDGRPYFRFYYTQKYLDFILFLLENNVTPNGEIMQRMKGSWSCWIDDENGEKIRLKVISLLKEKNIPYK